MGDAVAQPSRCVRIQILPSCTHTVHDNVLHALLLADLHPWSLPTSSSLFSHTHAPKATPQHLRHQRSPSRIDVSAWSRADGGVDAAGVAARSPGPALRSLPLPPPVSLPLLVPSDVLLPLPIGELLPLPLSMAPLPWLSLPVPLAPPLLTMARRALALPRRPAAWPPADDSADNDALAT